jgi:hypothetical protein
MSKRFRIAFSFAGEKRDFVARVATVLAKIFGEDRVLYDKYHEAEFARSDLALYLPPFYHDHLTSSSQFCARTMRRRNGRLEWKAIWPHQATERRGSDALPI